MAIFGISPLTVYGSFCYNEAMNGKEIRIYDGFRKAKHASLLLAGLLPNAVCAQGAVTI